MDNVFLAVLSLSAAGSVLILLIALLQRIFRDKCSQRWRYYIWLVVILRLLVPISLGGGVISDTVERLVPQEGTVSADGLTAGEAANDPVLDTQPQAPASPAASVLSDLTRSLWIVWIAGAGILLVKKIAGYHAFLQYVSVGCQQVEDDHIIDVYYKVCEEQHIRHAPALRKNELLASPMLVGVFRPMIVLPDIPDENGNIRNVLHHELLHYKRGDLYYKWLAQLAACVHWFNPLVYWMNRGINRSCELSCDETLIRHMDADQKYWYGETLLATVRPGKGYTSRIVSVTLNEDASQLEERLDAIMNYTARSHAATALSVLLTLVLVTIATTTGAYAASGTDRVQTVFSLKNSGLYAEGGYAYNETFTLREDMTVRVATKMESDAGRLRFTVQAFDEDGFYMDGVIVDPSTRQPLSVLYQVQGQVIDDSKSMILPAGKYYVSVTGTGLLRNAHYEISGVATKGTARSAVPDAAAAPHDVDAAAYLASSQVWQSFLQRKSRSDDKHYSEVDSWPEFMAYYYEGANASAPGVGNGFWVQDGPMVLRITVESVSGTMNALRIQQSNESPVLYLEDVTSGQYLVTVPPRQTSYHIWFAINDYYGNILVERVDG